MQFVRAALRRSERRICRVIGHWRSTQRYIPLQNPFGERIRTRVLELASEFGRYVFRTITDMLRLEALHVGKDRFTRFGAKKDEKCRKSQPKRGRLWQADGSTIRLRSEFENHVRSYDFLFERTHDGRTIKILSIIDKFSRKCLACLVARRIRAQDVILLRADLYLKLGNTKYVRSDNGPKFIVEKLRHWFRTLEVEPLYIMPGAPWENGYVESFNKKIRDQFLNGEIFYTLREAQVLIERWRIHYNMIRPHSSLHGRPPAAEAMLLAGKN